MLSKCFLFSALEVNKYGEFVLTEMTNDLYFNVISLPHVTHTHTHTL